MKKDTKYLLVDIAVLPEVFRRVMEVKKILAGGKVKSVNEAVLMQNLSRSAYYKYKDCVFPFYENTLGKVITLFFVVEDFPGILSKIINEIAEAKGNILTINQSIPINGLADVTISIETEAMVTGIENMMQVIMSIEGVKRQEILARD